MIRVNRAEFLHILSTVQPGLSSKDLIQQSSCFVFRDGWVVTFNGEIACRTKTPLPEDFSGAVHAEPLLRVLGNIQDDFVDLDADKKPGELLLRSYSKGSKKESGIRMEAEIVLPVDEVERPGEWVSLPQDFSEGIRTVKGAVGTNQQEFLTVVIHLHPDWLEACDRFQVTRYFIKTGVTRSFLVRESALRHVAVIDPVKMSETSSWVHFRNKSLIYSCRRHLEAFPDLEEFLRFKGSPSLLPEGTVQAAKLAEVFSSEDKDNNKVMVRLENNKMVVRGEGTNGWASEELDMDYTGDSVLFRIAPDLLIKLITEKKSRCQIGPGKLRVDGAGWTYLTILGKPVKDTPKVEEKPKREKKEEPAVEPERRRGDDEETEEERRERRKNREEAANPF